MQSAAATEARDIYDLLGVSPQASPKMAQAMYWARVRELREAERRGDESARLELEQLNQALEIISDDRRRAAYDEGKTDEVGTEAVPSHHERGRRSPRMMAAGSAFMAAALVVLLAARAAGTGLLTMPVPPLAIIAPMMFIGFIFFAAGVRRRVRVSAFDVLELAPDATPDDIDFAYRTLASAWLGQLRANPEVAVSALERLDRAYATAMAPHLGGAVLRPDVGRRMRSAWTALRATAAWLAARDWRRFATALWEITVAVSVGLVAFSRWAYTTGRAIYQGEDVEWERTPEPAPHIDLDRRLSASVHAIAQTTTEAVREERAAALPENIYALVLETPVGNRRIPVGERPLRIGSGEDADVALEHFDDQSDQVLLWVNGEDLVLHATSGATCAVNGQPSTWARLEPGDTITIGHTTLKVEAND